MCNHGRTINCPKCKDYYACLAEETPIDWDKFPPEFWIAAHRRVLRRLMRKHPGFFLKRFGIIRSVGKYVRVGKP